MSTNGRTIYSASRIKAGISQEDAAFMLSVSTRQLGRYESSGQDSDTPQDEIVAAMVNAYGSKYLAYLHAIKSPAVKMLLPDGVEQVDMVHAIAALNVAASRYVGKAMEIQAATLDSKIEGAQEQQLWSEATGLLEEMAAAIIQVKCATLSQQ